MRRFTRKRGEAAISLAVAGLLLFTTLPVSGGLTKTMNVSAAESEVSVSEHTYTFSDNTGKTNPNVGEILEGTNTETTGILYYASDGSGLTFDPTQLKFRQGNVMYLPIQDDTTKITYTQTCSGSSATRPTYLFDKDSGYHVDMNTTAQSVTVSDITDYSKVINGQKYFGVISGGDVKITKITVTEYNPVNEVTVSGKVAQAVENGVTEILFKNMDDSSIPVVTAQIGQDGSYQTTLRRIEGNSNYAAILSKTGFKVDETNGANRFALTGNEGQAVEDFSVIPAETTSISGTVTGIPDNACKDTLKVILVPQDPVLSNVELNLTRIADGNYQFQKAILAPDQEYQVTLENADDYEVTQTIQKAAGNYDGVELMAAPKALQNVSGTFVTSDEKEADVKNVTFTNMDTPEYSYTFSVTGNQYQAQLRAGEYETSAEVDSYTVFDHVSVADQAVQNRIYLKAPQDTSAVAYQSEILVGEGQQYPTITKALDAVNRMTREDGQRVTIVLTDALYREQVVVDTPDITFKSKGDSPATITWYYGTNFSYYSADPSTDRTYGGLYSEQYAVDQYTKTNVGMVPGHWGSTVNIMAAATGFQADNVIFENSFNRYHTDEEVADGVGLGVDASKQDRSTASDDDVKKAVNKERACTMFLQADDCEFNNCSFLSGQDTMYTGDNTESS